MKRKYPFLEDLTEEEVRREIIKDHEEGLDPITITPKYGYHPKSVERIIRRYQGKKSFARRKGAGRPEILNQGEKTSIRNQV